MLRTNTTLLNVEMNSKNKKINKKYFELFKLFLFQLILIDNDINEDLLKEIQDMVSVNLVKRVIELREPFASLSSKINK